MRICKEAAGSLGRWFAGPLVRAYRTSGPADQRTAISSLFWNLRGERTMGFRLSQRVWLGGAALGAGLALAAISAQHAPAERVDYDAIYKIKDEGFQRSKVMEIVSWLTDVYGPRLTNSPGFRKAGDWAVKEMTSWGMSNVKLEPFPFGRGRCQ